MVASLVGAVVDLAESAGLHGYGVDDAEPSCNVIDVKTVLSLHFSANLQCTRCSLSAERSNAYNESHAGCLLGVPLALPA